MTEGNPQGESQGRDEQSLQARHKIKHLQHSRIDRFSSVLQVHTQRWSFRVDYAFLKVLCFAKLKQPLSPTSCHIRHQSATHWKILFRKEWVRICARDNALCLHKFTVSQYHRSVEPPHQRKIVRQTFHLFDHNHTWLFPELAHLQNRRPFS